MTADKVWIVDDDRSIRWVLEKALMQEGLEATAFEDAQTLLNKLGKEKPPTMERLSGRESRFAGGFEFRALLCRGKTCF